MSTKPRISKKRLQRHIDEVIAVARNLTPDVQTVIDIPGFEEQHAWVMIYVPDEVEDQIDDLVVEKIYDIFMETGCDIGAMVYGNSQLHGEAPRPGYQRVIKETKISKRQLQRHLNELIALAKTVTPDVEAVIQIPGAEGQHAWLFLYVPDELEEQIDELISQRMCDICLDTGCDIAAMVYEKSQLQQAET